MPTTGCKITKLNLSKETKYDSFGKLIRRYEEGETLQGRSYYENLTNKVLSVGEYGKLKGKKTIASFTSMTHRP